MNGVTGNPVTDGIGKVPLDLSIFGPDLQFMDRITPIAPATAAFTDDSAAADGLTVAAGAYKRSSSLASRSRSTGRRRRRRI